jgi:hypothetical protein
MAGFRLYFGNRVATAGGTTFTQAVGGSITMSGSLSRRVALAVGLQGSITAAGVVTKLTRKAFSGSITAAGAVLKRTRKVFTGSITGTGALVRKTRKQLGGVLTLAATCVLRYSTSVAKSGSITAVGNLATQFYAYVASTSAVQRLTHLTRYFGRR